MNELFPATVIIDGSFFLHRVLHIDEFQNMKTSFGQPTGGVYGVLTTIKDTLERFSSSQRCIVVFDSGHSARRKELFPDYKANRKAVPGETPDPARVLVPGQEEILLDVLPLFGLRICRLACKEGDDILGWYARTLTEDLVIATEDKDILQLVSKNVSVYRPIKGQFVALGNFREATGTAKALFLLRKAINGDPSDNIPGVPTVGDTTLQRLMDTAAHLLAGRTCSSLRQLLEEGCKTQIGVDTRNAKRYVKILENTATIVRNLELMDLTREPFTPGEEVEMRRVLDSLSGMFRGAEAKAFLEAMEFKSMLDNWDAFSTPFRRLK